MFAPFLNAAQRKRCDCSPQRMTTCLLHSPSCRCGLVFFKCHKLVRRENHGTQLRYLCFASYPRRKLRYYTFYRALCLLNFSGQNFGLVLLSIIKLLKSHSWFKVCFCSLKTEVALLESWRNEEYFFTVKIFFQCKKLPWSTDVMFAVLWKAFLSVPQN